MAEPLNATFFAFRKREGGGVLLGASLTFATVLVLMGLMASAATSMLLGGGPFDLLTNPAAGADPELASRMTSGGAFLGVILLNLVIIVFFFIAFAAYEAACLRWMIRGERPGMFGMTLDSDTWRVYGAYWMWVVFALGIYIAFFVLLIVAGLIGGAVNSATDSPAAGGAVTVVLAIAVCLAPIWVLTRLAPAAAVSVGKQRFAVMEAWKVSKGRFWSLFGAYFLLWLIYLVVTMALWGAMFGSFMAASLQGMSGANGSDFSERLQQGMYQALSAPGAGWFYWGMQILFYVVWMFYAVLTFGVNARAVLAAADEGKVEGVLAPNLARTFE